MKILFLTDNFPPETNAPATRTFEHCNKWIEMGYEITIVTCFPNFPVGKIYEGYKNHLYKIEYINGIKVIRVWSYITSNSGFIKRSIDYLSFGITSLLFGLNIKTDLIIATSPQFFTPISARFLSFFKNVPWVMEVRDLWPDSIVAVGSIKKKSFLFNLLKKIESHLYKSAYKIIVVTDSFKKYLINDQKIESKKIGVFKNGIVKKKIRNINKTEIDRLKKNLKLNNKIIFSYIGTHGMAHKLDFILNSIKLLKNTKFHFLFIGEGAEKSNLIKLKAKNKIFNVTFLKNQSKKDIIKYIELSDYSIVNLKKSDEFKNVIPSKIFENIAMSKPILLGVEGESKKLIEKYKVGITYIPENYQSFKKAIFKILQIDKEIFNKNKNKFLNKFDRDEIASKMIKFIID